MLPFKRYALEVQQILDQLPWQQIQQVVESLRTAWLANRQVFVMGNGGSAATASHVACDLAKNTAVSGATRLRVMSLNDNMAHFSAYANDNGYDHVFAEQLTNYVNNSDVVIAISASGNSPNVLRAIERAQAHGAYTIGWSGYQGGKLAQMVELPLVIPSDKIEQIEDVHLMLGHMVTVALRKVMQEEALAQPALVLTDLRHPAPLQESFPQSAPAIS
jgi:D-sedoheptulose 7-phosphate isomerase